MNNVNNSLELKFDTALKQRDIQDLKRILDQNFDPDTRVNGGHTALMQATYKEDAELCEVLLSYGANMFAFDAGGNFPFRAALANEPNNIVPIFIKSFISIEIENNLSCPSEFNGYYSPLHSTFLEYKAERYNETQDDIVDEVLGGIPKNWLYLPLIGWTARYNLYLECFNLLLLGADPYCLAGDDVYKYWKKESDPIEIAMRQGHKDIVILLLVWRRSPNDYINELSESEKNEILNFEDEALKWIGLIGNSCLNLRKTPSDNEAVQEIPIKWPIGESVIHPTFGTGIILGYDKGNTHAQVNFLNEGIKWLSIEYAKLSEV